jgi:hypothetical protein
MRARKINCSTKCPLDGTPRATLRGLLEDCTTSEKSSARRQYSTVQYKVRIRLPRRAVQYRASTEEENQYKKVGVQRKE